MQENKAGIFNRLDVVIIRVKDVKLIRDWYEQVLELKLAYFDENELMAVYKTGTDVSLTIWQIKPGGNIAPACLNGSFPIFYSDNIEEVHKLLKERNVIVEEVHGTEFFKYFGFFDPEGNRMEVCQYFK
ncbi:MAG: VOC family protein [Ignavibacteriae bacterium]|nr:MAG: VOC family protein [Ignavibacteriota bacterium]